MKDYPHIVYDIRTDIPIISFDKIDGSNIRAEWSRKRGFYKFGSRNRLLDPNEKPLGEAIPLIMSKYDTALNNIFRKERYESAVAFFEFYGPRSAFGQHVDEPHDVILFDVAPFKQGILPPREFIKLFGHLHVPAILYEGKANFDLVAAVKNNTLLNMTFEGVVCKGQNDKKTKQPIMFKIKSSAWRERLKEYCAGNDELFNQLL